VERLFADINGLLAELGPEDLPRALRPWFEGELPRLRGGGGVGAKGDGRGRWASFAWERAGEALCLAVRFGPREALPALRRRARRALEGLLLDLGLFPTREEEAEGVRFLGLRSARGPSWAELPGGLWVRVRGLSWSGLGEAARRLKAEGGGRPSGPKPRRARVARGVEELLRVVRLVGPSFSWREAMERGGEALKAYIEWFGLPPARALPEAVRSRNLEALRVLLSKGLSPDLREEDGTPVLHLAAKKNFTEGVVLLLAHGADRRAVDPRGRRALELATNREIASLLEEGEVRKTPKGLLGILSEV